MNADFLENLISVGLPQLFSFAMNGEIRLLGRNDDALIDEQGFPASSFAQRAESRIPCSWTEKRADEITVAVQTRARQVYEITIAGTYETIIEHTDRIELYRKPGAIKFEILEIIALISQNNTTWLIYAVNL